MPEENQEFMNAPVESDVKEQAVQKLEEEMKSKEATPYDKLILRFLINRCREDQGMAEDVMQEHKTYKKCFEYVKNKARGKAKNGMAAVEDSVVYEWAEDYFHLDDKALEEKKKKEAAERAKKNRAEKKQVTKAPWLGKETTKKDPEKKTEKSKDIDGQMSLFDMM